MARLAKAIDKFVADHKDAEARAFIVLLADNSAGSREALTAFAAKHDVATPLTLPANGKDPGGLSLNKDVPLTVLCYRRKKVEANFAFAGDPPAEAAAHDKQIAEVIAAAEAMLK